ncbi:SLBB domain-containing protein [Shewanella sp. 10N.286.52.E4]
MSAVILISLPVQAVTPSPQMIEQFKSLPASEQQRLAKQYGVDLTQLNGSSSANTPIETPQIVNERKDTNEVVDQSTDDELNQETKTEDQIKDLQDEKKQQLKRFGYDLFAGEPTTFAPVSDAPVPAEYKVGPGDTINVQLYGKESNQYSLTVGRDGAIQFPNLGPISLVGLSFSEVKKLLNAKINETMIGINASISMGELRSIRIFIAGDSYKPGSYTVSSLSTITQALFVSGGVNEIGSLRNIQVKRNGKTIGSLDLYDLLLRGDASGDLRLQSGDVVFIPSSVANVSVMGEVRRPAIYELKNNETMADVLRMASGLNPGAYPRASTVERYSKQAQKTVLSVDLTTDSGLNIPVKNGDLLNVRSASSRVDNVITIAGAVIRAGKYQWTSGISISDLLPSMWGDLTIEADLDYSLLIREINKRGDIEVHRISLSKAINQKDSQHDLVLQPRDTLLVFDYADREKLLEPVLEKIKTQSRYGDVARIVDINGNVRFPGQYPLTVNADIQELLIAAGGLEEGAYTLAAELTRQNVSETSGVSIEHIQLSLDEVSNNVTSSNIALQSRDILTVRTLPDWQETRWVDIKGEVKFPGTYSIQRGESLKDVIARAGGLTDDAAPRSAVFLRESIKEKEQRELQMLSNDLRREIAAKALTKDGGVLNYNDAQLMLKELENVEVVGRLVVDITAIQLGIEDADLDLESADKLYIPAKNQTVSVMGQVQHPSTHRYKKGITFSQYMELAGGPRKRADDGRTYIIKADGSVDMPSSNFWFGANAEIEAGDTIIVPLDTEYKDNLTLWTQVTTIIYNSAIAVATISTL